MFDSAINLLKPKWLKNRNITLKTRLESPKWLMTDTQISVSIAALSIYDRVKLFEVIEVIMPGKKHIGINSNGPKSHLSHWFHFQVIWLHTVKIIV